MAPFPRSTDGEVPAYGIAITVIGILVILAIVLFFIFWYKCYPAFHWCLHRPRLHAGSDPQEDPLIELGNTVHQRASRQHHPQPDFVIRGFRPTATPSVRCTRVFTVTREESGSTSKKSSDKTSSDKTSSGKSGRNKSGEPSAESSTHETHRSKGSKRRRRRTHAGEPSSHEEEEDDDDTGANQKPTIPSDMEEKQGVEGGGEEYTGAHRNLKHIIPSDEEKQQGVEEEREAIQSPAESEGRNSRAGSEDGGRAEARSEAHPFALVVHQRAPPDLAAADVDENKDEEQSWGSSARGSREDSGYRTANEDAQSRAGSGW